MDEHSLLALAAQPLAATVRAVRPDQVAAPTPCREWTVRDLVNHLLFWGPSLVAAADRRTVDLPAATERDVDLTTGDWTGRLVAQLDATVEAWGRAAAWQGTTALGGPPPLPAPMVGGMVLGELVVHGWDLARATGQRPEWSARVLDLVYRELAGTAEQGRDMGVYGPPVPVPDGAPVLGRILGLTGRDPGWTP